MIRSNGVQFHLNHKKPKTIQNLRVLRKFEPIRTIRLILIIKKQIFLTAVKRRHTEI